MKFYKHWNEILLQLIHVNISDELGRHPLSRENLVWVGTSMTVMLTSTPNTMAMVAAATRRRWTYPDPDYEPPDSQSAARLPHSRGRNSSRTSRIYWEQFTPTSHRPRPHLSITPPPPPWIHPLSFHQSPLPCLVAVLPVWWTGIPRVDSISSPGFSPCMMSMLSFWETTQWWTMFSLTPALGAGVQVRDFRTAGWLGPFFRVYYFPLQGELWKIFKF